MPSRRDDHSVWQKLAAEQEYMISRVQLAELGLPVGLADEQLRAGHWKRDLPGVYRTAGLHAPASFRARVWSALLYAGPDAAASGATALALYGVIDAEPSVVEISIPRPRQVRRQPGLRVRRVLGLDVLVHPALAPSRTRLEVAVLDHADACRWPDAALDALFRSTQRRLTTAVRLRAELARRPRHRWRALFTDVLAEVQEGVASPLELRYLKRVERAHGLPRSKPNRSDRLDPSKPNRYRDLAYRWNLIVETDGREAHPVDEEFRDLDRDNRVTVGGQATLRYGYRDVVARPCEAAIQVSTVLRLNGWRGRPKPCCALCPVGVLP